MYSRDNDLGNIAFLALIGLLGLYAVGYLPLTKTPTYVDKDTLDHLALNQCYTQLQTDYAKIKNVDNELKQCQETKNSLWANLNYAIIFVISILAMAIGGFLMWEHLRGKFINPQEQQISSLEAECAELKLKLTATSKSKKGADIK